MHYRMMIAKPASMCNFFPVKKNPEMATIILAATAVFILNKIWKIEFAFSKS